MTSETNTNFFPETHPGLKPAWDAWVSKMMTEHDVQKVALMIAAFGGAWKIVLLLRTLDGNMIPADEWPDVFANFGNLAHLTHDMLKNGSYPQTEGTRCIHAEPIMAKKMIKALSLTIGAMSMPSSNPRIYSLALSDQAKEEGEEKN